MTDKLEDRMQDKIDAARRRIDASGDGQDPGPDESEIQEVPDPDELRQVFRKFRRLLGAVGNPGTVDVKGALRNGWIVSSGRVDGYGDELFHVVMLTNGALHYFSGELSGEPIELTSKWFLGDSIPALEAKMPDTIAAIMAANNIDWLETEPPPGLTGRKAVWPAALRTCGRVEEWPVPMRLRPISIASATSVARPATFPDHAPGP